MPSELPDPARGRVDEEEEDETVDVDDDGAAAEGEAADSRRRFSDDRWADVDRRLLDALRSRPDRDRPLAPLPRLFLLRTFFSLPLLRRDLVRRR
jgi:hypothetical protein